jgi:hypothetical protein
MSNRLNWNKCAKENLTRRNGVTSIDNRKSVKFSCTIKHETAKAILVVADDQECWLPKSLVEVDKLGDGRAHLVLPEWLAAERGLI